MLLVFPCRQRTPGKEPLLARNFGVISGNCLNLELVEDTERTVMHLKLNETVGAISAHDLSSKKEV